MLGFFNIKSMAMELIDGKKIAQQIKEELTQEVAKMMEDGQKQPHLVAVIVGNDGASQTYVNSKVKACEKIGFKSSMIELPENTTEAELLAKVEELNNNEDIDGYIVQLPLPSHINEDNIIEAVDPKKDVDGFHPVNFGRMSIGLPAFHPATPAGIVELIKRYGIETSGKHCVVLGRSNIVGRPMSILMSQKGMDATVTVAHSRTKNLKELCQQADILIVGIGKPEFLTAEMVKEGAVVIDVGIHRLEDKQSPKGYVIKGDVKFDEVAPKCSYITPVPGGVGVMTIVSLLINTLKSAKKEIYK